MARSSEIHDHTKSGQLRQRGRNLIKTEPMNDLRCRNKLSGNNLDFATVR